MVPRCRGDFTAASAQQTLHVRGKILEIPRTATRNRSDCTSRESVERSGSDWFPTDPRPHTAQIHHADILFRKPEPWARQGRQPGRKIRNISPWCWSYVVVTVQFGYCFYMTQDDNKWQPQLVRNGETWIYCSFCFPIICQSIFSFILRKFVPYTSLEWSLYFNWLIQNFGFAVSFFVMLCS